MSLIARTAAIGRNAEELQWDLNYLLQLWKAIEGAANQQSGAFLIYQEGSLVIRAIRDYFQPDIGEILIDTDDVYEQARQFMAHVMPGNVNRIKRYHDDVPLFSRFQIEHQIESAYSRQVNLPSGGAIVIDHTEALVSVDVNSGAPTRGADIEETAFKHQPRSRRRSRPPAAPARPRRPDRHRLHRHGVQRKNQREVENRLRDALRHDRARVQTGKISRFGLMELSRQRLRPALAETSYITCPRCNGTGHIRSTESAALHILRILEEEAMKDNTGAVHARCRSTSPPSCSTRSARHPGHRIAPQGHHPADSQRRTSKRRTGHCGKTSHSGRVALAIIRYRDHFQDILVVPWQQDHRASSRTSQ
jgi:ribonuclease E